MIAVLRRLAGAMRERAPRLYRIASAAVGWGPLGRRLRRAALRRDLAELAALVELAEREGSIPPAVAGELATVVAGWRAEADAGDAA